MNHNQDTLQLGKSGRVLTCSFRSGVGLGTCPQARLQLDVVAHPEEGPYANRGVSERQRICGVREERRGVVAILEREHGLSTLHSKRQKFPRSVR